jgi:hypothetical protein
MATGTMATMTGSEKQVAWATDLRARMLTDIDGWEATYAKPEYPNYALRQRKAAAARRFLTERADAGWFIEHRDMHPQQLINWLDDEGLL